MIVQTMDYGLTVGIKRRGARHASKIEKRPNGQR